MLPVELWQRCSGLAAPAHSQGHQSFLDVEPIYRIQVINGPVRGSDEIFLEKFGVQRFRSPVNYFVLVKKSFRAYFHYPPQMSVTDTKLIMDKCLKLIGNKLFDSLLNIVCAGEDEFLKIWVVREGYVFSGDAHNRRVQVANGLFSQNGGDFRARSGPVVGFVHDPASIIQHRTGLGLGAYGAVRFRPSAVPPPGTAIDLTVERLESRK